MGAEDHNTGVAFSIPLVWSLSSQTWQAVTGDMFYAGNIHQELRKFLNIYLMSNCSLHHNKAMS